MTMTQTKTPIAGKLFLALLAVILSAGPLLADGFIIPRPRPGETIPPLTVKYHRVTVRITDQVARTSVDQVFVNDYGRDIEGTYIFPIPEDAAISEFALFLGDRKVEGEILDSAQARRVYEDIVRRLKDPALLEYVGRNLFRARIFPLPARGERRVQLTYTQVLKAERGLVKYVYPLNTERFSARPIKQVSLSAEIESRTPITNVYSSSHKISVRKADAHRATAGFEEAGVKPDKDFVLYYSLSPDEVGLSFLSSEGPEGKYFLLLASPRYAAEKEKVLDKNLILVLDSSGSMSGRKIRQAKDAARFIVDHLNDRDRFSIIDFDDGVTLFAPELVAAEEGRRRQALKFIEDIEDSGGTNINEALLRALGLMPAGDRPNYVLFLTDGQPTVGITGVADILKNVEAANTRRSRLFVFGVGNDVNTELLDKVSSRNRGVSVYVGENEDLEVALSSYYEKISSPLLADLALTFKGIEVSDAYPRILPDLFKGSQLVLIGRYTGKGPATVSLSGRVGREARTFTLENQKLARDGGHDFLPRLWATRRVGYLLEEIRLRGPNRELVDEVRKLGLKYGIVTPYTSFLVTEGERLRIDEAAPAAEAAMRSQTVTGAGGVQAAKISQKFKDQEQAAHVASTRIQYKGDKTFYLKDGVWTDSLFSEGGRVREIKFNSDEYFRLLVDEPGLAKYLSVGGKLIVVYKGVTYKIL
jgi:Ca-activated chloride channel family protein